MNIFKIKNILEKAQKFNTSFKKKENFVRESVGFLVISMGVSILYMINLFFSQANPQYVIDVFSFIVNQFIIAFIFFACGHFTLSAISRRFYKKINQEIFFYFKNEGFEELDFIESIHFKRLRENILEEKNKENNFFLLKEIFKEHENTRINQLFKEQNIILPDKYFL